MLESLSGPRLLGSRDSPRLTVHLSDSMSQFQAARNARNPAALNWSSNNCSNSPDNPFGFEFEQSCQRHDFGYRNTKNQGRFEAVKDRIDDQFKEDMYAVCDRRGQPARAACKGVANVYYEAVQAFGKRDGIEMTDF